jgi:polyferredoxin
MWLDPYGIFGRGVTLSGGLFFVVLALSFVGRGRFWCNWICPVGTLLQLISRFSVFKDRFEKCDNCEECRKCLEK